MISKKHWLAISGFAVLAVVVVAVLCVYRLHKDQNQTARGKEADDSAQVTAKKTTEPSPELASQYQEEAKGEASPQPQRSSTPKVRKSRSLRRPKPRRPEPIRFDETRQPSQDSS